MPVPITALYLAVFAVFGGVLAWPGLGMLLARFLHAIGIKADTIQSLPRGIGAGGTALLTLLAAGALASQFVEA